MTCDVRKSKVMDIIVYIPKPKKMLILFKIYSIVATDNAFSFIASELSTHGGLSISLYISFY